MSINLYVKKSINKQESLNCPSNEEFFKKPSRAAGIPFFLNKNYDGRYDVYKCSFWEEEVRKNYLIWNIMGKD